MFQSSISGSTFSKRSILALNQAYIIWTFVLWIFWFYFVLDCLFMNISSREDSAELLFCRTNGALECFNRELSLMHIFPRLISLLPYHTKNQSRERTVWSSCEGKVVHQPFNLFPVPVAYNACVYIATAPWIYKMPLFHLFW